MDMQSIGKLLQSICVHYPSFKKEAVGPDNKFYRSYIEEWHKHIGFLDCEEAEQMLTDWIMSDNGKYAPKVSDFLKAKDRKKPKAAYFMDNTPRRYHIGRHGELLDENEMEYGNPECIPYYYDKSRNICRKDRNGREIVIIPERMVMEL